MQAPDPIETVLFRLMPPALSENAQHSIEAMLDELGASAGGGAAVVAPGKLRFTRIKGWGLPLGIAASLAALFALHAPGPRHGSVMPQQVKAQALAESGSGLVLLGESDRIETMSDAGWMSDAEGVAMQAVRVRVVEANTLRDEESGIVVQVSDPREEMIFMPVTVF